MEKLEDIEEFKRREEIERKVKEEIERIKKIKRDNLQEILGLIKNENNAMHNIYDKWWKGEEIGLREREEFYHRRLYVANLTAKRVSFMQDNTSSEYVDYYCDACSAENKEFRESRGIKE